MNTKNILTSLLVALCISVVMTACASAPTPTPIPIAVPTAKPTVPPTVPPQAAIDPIAVVKAYNQTRNTGDFEKALAFYADDAISNTPIGLFIGKAQISKWLENDVKTTRAESRDFKMQGALVVNLATASVDRFVKAGIPSIEARNEFLIDKNGKIRYFAPTVMLTSEQQQKMSAAQASAPPAPAPSVNPSEVVKAYVETANSGDLDKTLALIADDSGAFVMNGTLLLSGKTQIASWLKDDIKTTRAQLKDTQVNGNLVVATGTVSLDRFKNLGIDSVEYRAQYVIENGKIRFFYPTLQFTPEQLAKVQAAQQPQATPSR